MNVLRGIIGAVIGGLIGAAVWAGISFAAGLEIGWIAWGVGGLVGLGSAFGSKGGSPFLGVVAAAITILAIMGGKYAAIQFSIVKEIGSQSDAVQQAVTALDSNELLVSYLADDVVIERQANGEDVEWPAGVNPQDASTKSDYAPEVWDEAESRWSELNDSDRESFRAVLAEQTRLRVEEYYAEVSKQAFMSSFGPMDLLFFGLAIVTAFKIAASGEMPQPVEHLDGQPAGELQADPNNPESLLKLAAELDQAGRRDDALELYRQVAKNWPEEHGPYAQTCIQEIEKKMAT